MAPGVKIKGVRGGGLKGLERAQKKIDVGDYYEAHQVYRTIYFRYMSAERYGDAIAVCMHGAITLFKCNQNNSAADLALLVLVIYTDTKAACNDENRARIMDLLPLFPSNHLLKNRFMHTAIKWSQREGIYHTGDPILHQMFGENLYNEGKYSEAQEHFIKCIDDNSVDSWSDLLIKWALDSNQVTIDGLLTTAVLRLLCLGDLKRANSLYSNTLAKYPDSIDNLVLFKFCDLLLQSCERDCPPLFRALCQQFSSALERKVEDPKHFTDTIGQMYFNIPIRQAGLAGLMSQMMGGGGGGFGLGGGHPGPSHPSLSLD